MQDTVQVITKTNIRRVLNNKSFLSKTEDSKLLVLKELEMAKIEYLQSACILDLRKTEEARRILDLLNTSKAESTLGEGIL